MGATKYEKGFVRSRNNEELVNNFLRYGVNTEYYSKVNSMSFSLGELRSYELPIARFYGPFREPTKLFVLERSGLSNTTNQHISLITRAAYKAFVVPVMAPAMSISYEEACEYLLDGLKRIEQRWERSQSKRTLAEYLQRRDYVRRVGAPVPPLSSRMHVVAMLEGHLNG